MATRHDLDVTLPHELADHVARMLQEHARELYSHARRTRVEAVRASCIGQGQAADAAVDHIIRHLYEWR